MSIAGAESQQWYDDAHKMLISTSRARVIVVVMLTRNSTHNNGCFWLLLLVLFLACSDCYEYCDTHV